MTQETEREALISDEELGAVFESTNFGVGANFREIVADTLLKLASDFSTGHTAIMCCKELGLVGKKSRALTKKGRRYLYYAMQARARGGNGEVEKPPARTYYAWLIEQRDIHGKPTWLKIDNFVHEQTDSAWDALHFGRKVDAEAYAAGNEDEVIYITGHAFPALSTPAKPVEVGELAELISDTHCDNMLTTTDQLGAVIAQAILAKYNVTEK